MYTEFKFSPAQISMATVRAARTLAASRPGTNPAAFAAGVITERLRRNPSAYLQFGPYWWAVKSGLAELGQDLGAMDDAGLRLQYGGGLAVYSRLVAGELFRDHYLITFLAGTAVFTLGEEVAYVLVDADMEARRLGAAPKDQVIHEPSEPEPLLDSVEQVADTFTVAFQFGGEPWAAEIRAASQEEADARVQVLDSAGDLRDAIAFAQGVGESTVSTEDYDRPLFVDLVARRVTEFAPVFA